jgi:hypothetical protein
LEKEIQAQRDDGKALSKQQKLAERYLAKRQMFSARKEVCSRSIRDLGVLPEEAFEKYTKDKSEKVSCFLHIPLVPWYSPISLTKLVYCDIAHQETLCCQRELEEVQSCE